MIYLLCKSEEDGLNHRIEYIFDIFKLYAIKTGETNKFIVLETFPFKTSTSYPVKLPSFSKSKGGMSPAVATTMVLGLAVEVEALSCLDCPQATNKGLMANNKNNFFMCVSFT